MRILMSRSSRLYLAASLILAVAAALLLHSYLRKVEASLRATGPSVPVVTASVAVERGSVLHSGQLRLIDIPQAFAPPGSFRDVRHATGRVVVTDLSPGEAVTSTRLAPERAGPVASLVPRGLRAFAIPTSLPHGTVSPGDRVDVLATYSSGQPHTEKVVEAVEVLLALGPGGPETAAAHEDAGLHAPATSVGAPLTLVVLVPPHLEQRLAFARAFADLAVAIAPPDSPRLS